MLLHIVSLIISLIISFLITLFGRNKLFRMLNFTYIKKEKTIISIDSDGIPYVDYGYRGNRKIGIQRNPVTIRNHAIKLYHEYLSTKKEYTKILFINNANWLLNNTVHKKDRSTLEYYFPLPIYNLEPPWRSAMANGQTLEVLCIAHKLTNDMKYLTNAKNILKSFFVEVTNGGVTYKDSINSWWYEEYVSDNKNMKESRVLNGMLFTLIGIYKYYKYTNDNDAKILFDNGIRNVVDNLHKYDDNGYSYYDLLHNPAHKYHQIHINLLNELYEITRQNVFKKFSDKWSNYKTKGLDKRKKSLSIYRSKKNIVFFIIIFLMIFIILELTIYFLR